MSESVAQGAQRLRDEEFVAWCDFAFCVGVVWSGCTVASVGDYTNCTHHLVVLWSQV